MTISRICCTSFTSFLSVDEYSESGVPLHQSLSGLAPAHLADDINLVAVSGCLLLQSAADSTCAVQHTNITCADKSSSSASMAKATVSRPDISYEQFKWQLKTLLFGIN